MVLEQISWSLDYDSDGVSLWTGNIETSSFKIVKRQMEVKASMMDLIKILRDPEITKSSDERVKEFGYCHEYNSNSHILRIRAQGNLLVSDRMLIVFTTLQQLNNGSYAIINFSIDTDKTTVDADWVLQ